MKYHYEFTATIKNAERRTGAQWIGLCPFHEDTKPSLSFNVETGQWKCFGCDAKGGIKEWRRRTGQTKGEAKSVTVKPIDPKLIENMHQNLLNTKDALDRFRAERGIVEETIKAFKIGWDGDRYWIPVIRGDVYWDVRKYKMHAESDKVLPFSAGRGVCVFPHAVTEKDPVLLCEGEPDTILAIQFGFNAVTNTCGALAWCDALGKMVAKRQVVVCYDNDRAGREGTVLKAANLLRYKCDVRIARIDGDPGRDVTDVLLTGGVDALNAIIDAATVYSSKASIVSDEVHSGVHLSDSALDDYIYTRIRCVVRVAGKDLTPYIVPKKVVLDCCEVKNKCRRCPAVAEPFEINLDERDDTMLRCVGVKASFVEAAIRERLGIGHCKLGGIQVVERTAVEMLKCIPEVEATPRGASSYVVRTGLYLGQKLLLNTPYEVEAVMMPSPHDQHAVLCIYQAKTTMAALDAYRDIDADTHERLRSAFSVV